MRYPAFKRLAFSVAASCASHSMVFADTCVDTSRSTTPMNVAQYDAKTTVKNQMSAGTLSVAIFRGENMKLRKTVDPGKEVSFDAGFNGENDEATLLVNLSADNGKTIEACSYIVSGRQGSWRYKLDWLLPPGASEVCPGVTSMAITCEKSFKKGNNRYHTVFSATDVQ